MSALQSRVDPANVVESLVYTLLEVLNATRDLYKTLRIKEKRDHEALERSKGYPPSPVSDHLDDDAAAGNASIVLDKAAVKREFENGMDSLGPTFAVGDVITQAALQSQIINLQSVLIDIFLYGPTSQEPLSQHLSALLAASRIAGTSAVSTLAAQRQRMLSTLPAAVRPPVGVPPPSHPVRVPPRMAAVSTGSPPSKHTTWPASPTSLTPSIQDMPYRPKASRSDTESTAFTGLTASGAETIPQPLYCTYAVDLQNHRNQSLSSTITANPSPYCPDCSRSLHLSPGKAWEIFKETEDGERCFRIQNRFVVKCHRRGEQGYSCVLCHDRSDVDTVCGDVKALVRHVWLDHSIAELKNEEDIVEVIDGIIPKRKVLARGRSVSDGAIWKEQLDRARIR